MKKIMNKWIGVLLALAMILQSVTVQAENNQGVILPEIEILEENVDIQTNTVDIARSELDEYGSHSGEEVSTSLNLDEMELTTGFVADEAVIEYSEDTQIEEDTLTDGLETLTVQDVQLQAGEEEFPDNSESVYSSDNGADLGEELPDESEIVLDDEGKTEEIQGQSGNGDLNATGPSIVSVSSIVVEKGNSASVVMECKDFSGTVYLQYGIWGEDKCSASWGSWSGNKIPLTIRGKSAGSAYIYVYMRSASNHNILCTKSIQVTVTNGVKVTASASTVSIKQGSAQKVTLSYSGISESVYMQYGITNANAFSCSWGNWSGASIPLTISGKAAGTGKITVYLKRASTGQTLASTSITVSIKATPKLTVSSNSVSIVAGSTSSVTVKFSNYSEPGYLQYSTSNSTAYSCSWGNWSGTSIPLSVKGLNKGSGKIYIYLKAAESNVTLASASISVYVSKAEVYASNTSVTLKTGEQQTVNITTSGTSGPISLAYGTTGDGIYSCSWGSWSGSGAPLTIKGTNAGKGKITIYLRDGAKNVLNTVTINISVTQKDNANIRLGTSSVELAEGNATTVPVTCENVSGSFYLNATPSNSSVFRCSWGEWSGSTNYLTITGLKEGSGTVTISLKNATNNTIYTSKTISVTIKASGNISLADLSYQFGNFGEAASLPVCQYMYGKTPMARSVYYSQIGAGGNCFGMSSTAGLFYVSGNEVNVSSFGSGKNLAADLVLNDRNSGWNMTVKEFVQGMQITQVSNKYSYNYISNVSNLNELINDVNYEVKSGRPVMISVWGKYNGGNAGHAVLAYGTQRVSATETRLLIYDNNYPMKTRYLTINKNSAGTCTSWSYPLTDSCIWGYGKANSGIAYTNYSMYKSLWDQRGKLANSSMNLLVANSDDFEIYDVYDYPIATVKDGVLKTDSEDIRENLYVSALTGEDGKNDNITILYLPIELYTLKNTDETLDEFRVAFVDEKIGVHVATKAGEVTVCADDDCDLAAAMLLDCDQEDYQITLLSTRENGEMEQVEINGTGNGDIISAMLDSGMLETCNIGNEQIKISDGTEVEKSVSEITLDRNMADIVIGENITLNATVHPDDAVGGTVKWESSDNSIAEVDESGKVLAIGVGTVKITAKAGDKTAECLVTVQDSGNENSTVSVEKITLSQVELSLSQGGTATLTATIEPQDATDRQVVWSSSDPNIAKVEDGLVTAVAVGTAQITVTTKDGGHTATCTITVVKAEEGTSDSTDKKDDTPGTTDADDGILHIAAKGKVDVATAIKAKLTPDEAARIKKYKSSSSKIATVNKKGIVTGKKDGTATITAYEKVGKKYVELASVEVEVKKPVFKFTKTILQKNEEIDPYDYISNLPKGAKVTWSVPAKKAPIATLNEDSIIVPGGKSGSVKVTCIIGEGAYAAKYTATLKFKLPKLAATTKVKVGKAKKITVSNVPKDAKIEWDWKTASGTLDIQTTKKPNAVKVTVPDDTVKEAEVYAIVNGVTYTTKLVMR